MKTSFFFSFRYLFSKKTHNAVNYISWISVLGFFGGSFAMVVILSTLNGFESLILSMYSSFDPDFKIELNEGKMITKNEADWKLFEKTPGLISMHEILEDQAVIKHFDYQTAVYIKGVSPNYFYETGLNAYVQDGSAELVESGMYKAIMGAGVDFKLQTRVTNPQSIATVYTPKRGNFSINDPNIIQSKLIKPGGVVFLDDQINQKYVFVPLEFAKELFDRENQVTYLELRVQPERAKAAEKYLLENLPSDYKLKNRMEQQASLYKMFSSEKWVTFALLAFVLLLASFNVMGSLTMLVVEKEKDIFTLKTLGANANFIRTIFLAEGMLISLAGGVLGIVLGCLLVTAQDKLGLVKMNGAIVENYPVQLLASDILLIFGTTIVLGFVTSLYPAWKSYSKN